MLPTRAIFSAATLYFLLVFSAGFLCGMIRVPFIMPMIGDRRAQLLEMPIMLIVIWKSANLIVQRLHAEGSPEGPPSPITTADTLSVGLIAFSWLLGAEMGLAAMTQGWNGFSSFIFDRDEVTGAIYFMALVIFAVLPAWISAHL